MWGSWHPGRCPGLGLMPLQGGRNMSIFLKGESNMLRSSLCLLFTAMFASAAFAQQGRIDVQSLEYEFGRIAAPTIQDTTPVSPIDTNRNGTTKRNGSSSCPCDSVVPTHVVRQFCCVPVPRPCVPVWCAPVVRPVVCAPVVRVPKRVHRWHHPAFVHPGFVW